MNAVLIRARDAIIATCLALVAFVVLLSYADLSMPTFRKGLVTSVKASDVLNDDTFLPGDEGTIVSNADRVSRGYALYREVFDFKGPIGYAPYVVVFQFFKATVRGARIVMFLVMSVWTATMYQLIRRISGSRAIAVAAALWIPFQIWPAWAYAYQDFTAQMCLALSALSVVIAFDVRRDSTYSLKIDRWIVLAGATAALAVWTSLAQGLMGFTGIGAAIAVVALGSEGVRTSIRRVVGFACGGLVASAVVLAWLGHMGSIREGMAAMWLFPFKHYMSDINVTAYAYDANIYPDRWLNNPGWVHVAVVVCMQVTRVVPLLALGAVLVAGIWLAASGQLLPHRARASVNREARRYLARIVVPLALAGTAIPVILNKTRSDICHLSFIEGGCIVAVIALYAIRTGRAFANRAVKLAVSLMVVSPLLAAVPFFAYGRWAKQPGFVDPDTMGRSATSADVIAARTGPEDTIFVTPKGGWRYLLSGRENATSFALLIDDPYCSEQWPVAARQIVEKRPALLAITDQDFAMLVKDQPVLKNMYFGYSGNYILDERGRGPPFSLPARWLLTLQPAAASERHASFAVNVRSDGSGAKILATTEGRPGEELRAALQREIFSLFDGESTYVGHVSADGRSMEGAIYRFAEVPTPFSGRRLSALQ